jgi:hypothetical protein
LGSGGIAPPFLTSALDGASRPGRLIPGEKVHCTDWIGWAGSRVGLDALKRINGIDGVIILKRVLNKFVVTASTQFVFVGFFEDGYESSRILKFKKFINHLRNCHLKGAPCYHGMARPQVADGGDGLVWIGFIWLRIRTCCEHGSGPSGSIKY